MTKKSQVWEYFSFRKQDTEIDKRITVCNICKCEFKYATGSTSSMNSHLSRKHDIVVKIVKVGVDEASDEKQQSVSKGNGQYIFCWGFSHSATLLFVWGSSG